MSRLKSKCYKAPKIQKYAVKLQALQILTNDDEVENWRLSSFLLAVPISEKTKNNDKVIGMYLYYIPSFRNNSAVSYFYWIDNVFRILYFFDELFLEFLMNEVVIWSNDHTFHYCAENEKISVLRWITVDVVNLLVNIFSEHTWPERILRSKSSE